MKRFFSKDKITAFLIHLAISLVIFLVLLYFILVYWYPHPLFGTDGGWQGIRLIAAVDIILGPFLTLIIFKKGKPRLKLDLTLIAFVQISALMSGTWVVYNEHPALVVFLEDSFRPVTAAQLIEQDIPVASVRQYSESGLPMAFVNLPDNIDALYNLRKESLRIARPLSLYQALYEPLNNEHKQTIRSFSINMEDYLKDRPEYRKKYENFLQRNTIDLANLIFLPLYSRYKIVIAVLDSDTIEFIDIIDIFPPGYGVQSSSR